MERKAIFFDVDRTIWDRYNYIPHSTRQAMKALKNRGHLTFINSGRGRGFIFNEDLLSLDFDGIISGCGTMAEYHGEVLYYSPIDIDIIEWSLEICKKYGFAPILEGPDYLYMNQKDFPNDAYVEKISKELGARLKPIDDTSYPYNASKFSIACAVPEREKGLKELERYFSIIPHGLEVAEIVPINHDKGFGIRKVCELLNINIKDTYAFGDSRNDIEMFHTAGTSICMGDGYDIAKEAADYVTDPLMEDGIKNACEHFGLI